MSCLTTLQTFLERMSSGITLDAMGLVALADLKILQRRTAITGSASLADALVLCPGLHRQQDATSLNAGEYPITANMTTNYVFRVENQATVAYMQSVGRTAHLTTLYVEPDKRPFQTSNSLFNLCGPPIAQVCYIATIVTTLLSFVFLASIQDYWMAAIFMMLTCARLLTMTTIRRRSDADWHGAKEPGKRAELLILMSQDRWIRLYGLIDDLKAVTSGEWLREPTLLESAMEGIATMLVYLSAALVANGTQAGKMTFLALFIVNAGLLATSNGLVHDFYMKNRIISQVSSKKYRRRLDLAHELLRKSTEKDWALKIGLVNDLSPYTDKELPQTEAGLVQV